jgi:hypothetical protein
MTFDAGFGGLDVALLPGRGLEVEPVRTLDGEPEALGQTHVERTLPVDEACDAAHLLRLDHPLSRQRGLACRGLTEHLHHAPERQTAVVATGHDLVQRRKARVDEVGDLLVAGVLAELLVQLGNEVCYGCHVSSRRV